MPNDSFIIATSLVHAHRDDPNALVMHFASALRVERAKALEAAAKLARAAASADPQSRDGLLRLAEALDGAAEGAMRQRRAKRNDTVHPDIPENHLRALAANFDTHGWNGDSEEQATQYRNGDRVWFYCDACGWSEGTVCEDPAEMDGLVVPHYGDEFPVPLDSKRVRPRSEPKPTDLPRPH